MRRNQELVNRRLIWLKHDIRELSDVLGPDPEQYIDWQQALEDVEDKIRRIRARVERKHAEYRGEAA
jgi:hypothetical protein